MSKSLRSIWSIAKREYKSYFASSLAYVFLLAFLVVSTIFCFKIANWYGLNEASLRIMFDFHPYLYLFFIPAVGMRMWSEEDRVGTMELLLTMPVTVWQAVLGKFLAAWGFIATALLLTLPMVVTSYILGDPDTGRMIAGYGGSLLLGGMCLALCGLCSSLTQNQVTSYICSFLLLLVVMVTGMQQLGVEDFLSSFLPARVVETLIFFSVIPHIESLARGVFDLRDIIYFGSLMAFGMGSTVAILRCRKAAHKFNRSITTIAIFLTFVSVVILNLIVRDVSVRKDLSADKLYTLSSSTLQSLQGLESPTRIRFYFSKSTSGISMQQKALARRVEDLLREYEEKSNGMLKLEVLDPQPGTPAETSARFDGLTEINMGVNSHIYMGFSIVYQDKVMTIPAFTSDEEDELELNVTRLLFAVQEEERPVVLFQSSLPVTGMKADPNAGRLKDEPEWSIITQMRIDYSLLSLPPNTQKIPEMVEMVVLVHPDELDEKTMYALDQYLMKGGKIVCFLDNFSLIEGRFKKGRSGSSLSSMSTLFGFSEAWGVRYVPDEVVADKLLKTPVKGRENPYMLTLSRENMAADDVLFTNVNKLHIPYSGYFQTQEKEGLKYETLLHTSKMNKPVKRNQAFNSRQMIDSITEESDEKILALRISGKLNSAFSKFLPSEDLRETHIERAEKDAEVILISDADMLHDSFESNIQHMFDGRRERVSISDNTVLLYNLLDSELKDGSLIGLRGRRFKKRNLYKIYDRQVAQYNARQKEIEDLQLQHRDSSQVVKRLDDKMARQLSLTLEERDLLAKNRQVESDADTRLNEIESELKAEGKSFEKKVYLWNLCLPPLFVLLICLGRGTLILKNRRMRR